MITPPWWPIYFGFCGKIEILYKIVHFVFFPGFTAFLVQIVYFSCVFTWILWPVRAFMNIPPLLTHIFWVSHKICQFVQISDIFYFLCVFSSMLGHIVLGLQHCSFFVIFLITLHNLVILHLKIVFIQIYKVYSPSGIPTLRGTLLAVNQHFVITAFTTSRNIMRNITS